jgi:hypothetical protein
MKTMIVLLALAVAAGGVLLARALRARRDASPPVDAERADGSSTSLDPGQAIGFGYTCAWLAVRTTAPGDVVRALALEEVEAVGWPGGVDAAYDGAVFVTPPVDGWVLVASTALPAFGDDAGSPVALIERLSAALATEVQYFGTHRVVEYHAWAVARNGRRERAFAWLGERGEVLVDEGARRAGEPTLEPTGESPDEDTVMRVAAAWSVDPTGLADRGALGTGWRGRLPAGAGASSRSNL